MEIDLIVKIILGGLAGFLLWYVQNIGQHQRQTGQLLSKMTERVDNHINLEAHPGTSTRLTEIEATLREMKIQLLAVRNTTNRIENQMTPVPAPRPERETKSDDPEDFKRV